MKPDSPDEDKSIHDARLLLTTLANFFQKHPLIHPKTFLGDAVFDSVTLYKTLLSGDTFGNNCYFSKAYIPLNTKADLENMDYTLNENGIPCCPHDETLTMKYEGTYKLKSGVTRYKFIYPKVSREKNLCAYPGVIRGTKEWDNTYKI